jgi:hypothetical protein
MFIQWISRIKKKIIWFQNSIDFKIESTTNDLQSNDEQEINDLVQFISRSLFKIFNKLLNFIFDN